MHFISTKTSDGFHFNGVISESEGKKEGIIVHIHGMAGNFSLNSFYPNMHSYYSEHGWAFLAGENRGTGIVTDFKTDSGVQIVGNAFEMFEDCVKDIDAWVSRAEVLGYSRIWLQGHSLGPSKIAYYMNQTNDKRVGGLLFISPSDMLGLVHDDFGMKFHKVLLPEANRLVASGKPKQLLSKTLWDGYLLSAGTYLNLFADSTNTAIFNYNKLGLDWGVANKLSVPVLAFSGTRDDGVVPVKDAHEAMKQLKSELKGSPRVKTVVFEGAEHDFEGFGEKIAKEVVEFIGRV